MQNVEIERKFLLKNKPVENWEVLYKMNIKQGYLLLQDNKQIRIRLTSENIGVLCYKECFDAIHRKELEQIINYDLAKVMYDLCPIKLEKNRTKFVHTYSSYSFELDEYPNGLSVIEIEVQKEEEFQLIIDILIRDNIIGEEITGVKEYSNIEIAKKIS